MLCMQPVVEPWNLAVVSASRRAQDVLVAISHGVDDEEVRERSRVFIDAVRSGDVARAAGLFTSGVYQ